MSRKENRPLVDRELRLFGERDSGTSLLMQEGGRGDLSLVCDTLALVLFVDPLLGGGGD